MCMAPHEEALQSSSDSFDCEAMQAMYDCYAQFDCCDNSDLQASLDESVEMLMGMCPYNYNPCGSPAGEMECHDTNEWALDGGNNPQGCDWYWQDASKCGRRDDEDFAAYTMCCACGGGEWGYSGDHDDHDDH